MVLATVDAQDRNKPSHILIYKYALPTVQCETYYVAITAGPREQLNQASAYLDGSVVYGPSLNLTLQLRTMSGGQLRMSVAPSGRTLLPYSTDTSDGCNQKEEIAQGRYCFTSGTSVVLGEYRSAQNEVVMSPLPSWINGCAWFGDISEVLKAYLPFPTIASSRSHGTSCSEHVKTKPWLYNHNTSCGENTTHKTWIKLVF
jgi:hypothetical protein